MRDVVGSNSEEVKMIKETQRAVGTRVDGYIGNDTMTLIAHMANADCFPQAKYHFGYLTLTARSIVPFNPKGGIASYAYTMSGSFTYPSGVTPCSILVNRGTVLCSQSCHCWRGQPESVIYQLYDGTLGIRRCLTIAELPKGVKWAVGGMGLLDNWNPELEGFVGDQIGVQRKTGHTILAYKKGLVYGVCVPNMTSQQINALCKDTFQFEAAIQLDGGSVYYYNTPLYKKHNAYKCGYAIQFVKE